MVTIIDPATLAKRRRNTEKGAIIKEWGGVRLRVALVYPNCYGVGMSNLGFHKIYQLFNRRPDVLCERAFLPEPGELLWYEKQGAKKVTTLETGKPLADFDLVAFSVTFEADYLNLLRILQLAKIPVRRNERDSSFPRIAVGGICPTLNPEPLSDFYDMAFIGEGEEIVDPLCDALLTGKLDVRSPPGVYLPDAAGPVARVWDRSGVAEPNRTVIETSETVFGEMGLVEMGKGCGKHCRFCASGYLYRPTRHADTALLLAAIDEALATKGKVGLVGSAVADHPAVEEVFGHIVERGGAFSVSSLRLDKLTPSLLDALRRGGSKTITVAPEAGSERLRRIVNKNLPDDLILDGVDLISRTAPFAIKCYFLVGLPHETDDDVAGIVDLVTRMQERMVAVSRRRGSVGALHIGVDVFTPKPFTPWEGEPFVGVKTARRRLKVVREGLRKLPNVELNVGSAFGGYVSTLLSIGDKRVGALLMEVAREKGDWKKVLRESRDDWDSLVLERRTDFPWGRLDHGLRAGYLGQEARLAAKGKVTPECPPTATGAKCERCGLFSGVCV